MNSTLWVALAVVGCLAAILYALKYVTKQQALARKKALRNHYRSLLAQHNLSPDTEEEFPHRIFGLDASRRHFVLAQHDPAQPHEIIDLTEQHECRIQKGGVSVPASNGRTEEHINKIAIAFTSRSGVRISVPVYTEALDGVEQRQHLEARADTWLKQLRQTMSAMKEAA